MKEDKLYTSSTELVIIIGSALCLLSAIFNAGQHFFDDLPLEVYVTGAIYSLCVVICWIILLCCIHLLEKIVQEFHKKIETEEFQKHKINALIGFGGIGLGAIIPRVYVLFEDPGEWTEHYIFAIYPVFCFIWFHNFLKDLGHKYEYHLENDHDLLVLSMIFAHSFLGLVSCEISTFTHDYRKSYAPLVHIFFAVPMGVSTTDFMLVLAGGLQLKSTVNPIPDPQLAESDPRLECKICLIQYSQTRVPRILRECGHTICHDCAVNLLKVNNNWHLFCPFCQQMTVVKGSATLLAKNVALEEVVNLLN